MPRERLFLSWPHVSPSIPHLDSSTSSNGDEEHNGPSNGHVYPQHGQYKSSSTHFPTPQLLPEKRPVWKQVVILGALSSSFSSSTLLDAPPAHGEETACSACWEHRQVPLSSCRKPHAHHPLAQRRTGLPWGASHWRRSGESLGSKATCSPTGPLIPINQPPSCFLNKEGHSVAPEEALGCGLGQL